MSRMYNPEVYFAADTDGKGGKALVRFFTSPDADLTRLIKRRFIEKADSDAERLWYAIRKESKVFMVSPESIHPFEVAVKCQGDAESHMREHVLELQDVEIEEIG